MSSRSPRVQAGFLTPKQIWSDMKRDMPKGLPHYDDEGLDNTPTWGRTYWGWRDLLPARRSGDPPRHAEPPSACRTPCAASRPPAAITSSTGRSPVFLATADKAVGLDVMRGLYARLGDKPESVDLVALWTQLGVEGRRRRTALRRRRAVRHGAARHHRAGRRGVRVPLPSPLNLSRLVSPLTLRSGPCCARLHPFQATPAAARTSTTSRAPETVAWLLIAAIALTAAALMASAGLAFDLASALRPVVPGVILVCGAIFYRTCRPEEAIATTLIAVAQMLAFGAASVTLSYAVTAHGGPLWDETFAAWDRALGLDWRGYFDAVAARPRLAFVYNLAYASLIVQIILAAGVLGLTGPYGRLPRVRAGRHPRRRVDGDHLGPAAGQHGPGPFRPAPAGRDLPRCVRRLRSGGGRLPVCGPARSASSR